MKGRPKAFVQIQNGCDHNCSFCTITLARGRSRSVPLDFILDHVNDLCDQNVLEIILTGVDLTSYQDQGLTLGPMIQELLRRAPRVQRLRLSSLDSIEICPVLMELITQDTRILPHIHLSLQAGSDPILKSMKRRHTRAQAIETCQRLKQLRPDIALGADLIAGFPTETEELFQETLSLVQACQLTHLHVFPFSKRPGTLAARMPDQIDPTVIKERATRLRALGQIQMERWLARHKGQILTVLAENPWRGHSDDFSEVHFTQPAKASQIIRVHVQEVTERGLLAVPLDPV
jgi:threonylcarbamoyladenosine tRNA methylthiotransferase MtaB